MAKTNYADVMECLRFAENEITIMMNFNRNLIVDKLIKPFCEKNSLDFISGNGIWYFEKSTSNAFFLNNKMNDNDNSKLPKRIVKAIQKFEEIFQTNFCADEIISSSNNKKVNY